MRVYVMRNSKTSKRPSISSTSILVSKDNPFQELYEMPLTQDKNKEIKFNLVNFVEMLIKLDRQNKEWLKESAKSKNTKPSSIK